MFATCCSCLLYTKECKWHFKLLQHRGDSGSLLDTMMYVFERWDSAVGLYVILKVCTLWIIRERPGISH